MNKPLVLIWVGGGHSTNVDRPFRWLRVSALVYSVIQSH